MFARTLSSLACSGAIALHACAADERPGAPESKAIPVEIGEVERGSIDDARVFTGTLDAFTELAIAAKVAGRVERVEVDLGDPAEPGKLLVTLDDDEPRQAVSLAQADVTMANAQLIEVESSRTTASRELERVEQLHGQGLMSVAALDTARATERATSAAYERARGGLLRATAQLATARIQLGYTRVVAGELEGGGSRAVAARHVDPGDAVTANQPLLTLVEIDPLIAAITVTEQDYSRVATGQRATLRTDAVQGRTFEAAVLRIAPKFDEASRQARVELKVDNAEGVLKPGMFVRATLVLGSASDAIIVPEVALTRRAGRDGVFVVDDATMTVKFRPVEIGIRQGTRVQVRGEGITRAVVTLGQQLLNDGTRIAPPGSGSTPASGPTPAPAESKGDG
jgi:RND family efflux transporter MFP subunit